MTNRIIIRLIAALAVLAMLAGMLVAAANAEARRTLKILPEEDRLL